MSKKKSATPELDDMAQNDADLVPVYADAQTCLSRRATLAPRLTGNPLTVASPFQPAGDQPEAIKQLVAGVQRGDKSQILLGVTGSGKTYTMAKVIEATQRPALIMAHNKTLAAQLYAEFKSFFPNNAVEYFVSYYDYYQPEAYVARTDTYIAKESTINERIDRMRHAATRALLERQDTIIVASVSCLYGLGDVATYTTMTLDIERGMRLRRSDLLNQLVALQYKRNDVVLQRGSFRVAGENIDIWPAHEEDSYYRLTFWGDELENIRLLDALTADVRDKPQQVRFYAASHHAADVTSVRRAVSSIRTELLHRLINLRAMDKLVEAQRLEQRTTFDLEMLETTGSCQGIENYSRHLTGRTTGDPPPTLFEYLPANALLFVDESHVTLPQIGAMYRGDYRRKATLAGYGFRLPSCIDNRPLRFEEWDVLRPQTVFVSATPGVREPVYTDGVFVEQVIRPTGLLDPLIEVRPATGQVPDLLRECREQVAAGGRVLLTVLTKRMAEELTDYLHQQGLRVRYMHADIDTPERIDIVRGLRDGIFDILVGINLLREGLDIPECRLVAVADADKEGFLRSASALIQTAGRAARNVEGRVIFYGDKITKSMQIAIDETTRRRIKQQAHNDAHGIVPRSAIKAGDSSPDPFVRMFADLDGGEAAASGMKRGRKGKNAAPAVEDVSRLSDAQLEQRMIMAADALEFEEAARLRDVLQRRRDMGT